MSYIFLNYTSVVEQIPIIKIKKKNENFQTIFWSGFFTNWNTVRRR